MNKILPIDYGIIDPSKPAMISGIWCGVCGQEVKDSALHYRIEHTGVQVDGGPDPIGQYKTADGIIHKVLSQDTYIYYFSCDSLGSRKSNFYPLGVVLRGTPCRWC